MNRLAVALALALGAGPLLAQELPRPAAPPPANDPVLGHSAGYYGMQAPGEQEASLRSVLMNAGVDQAFLPRSLGSEAARFLVGLFLGGASAPTDLVESSENVFNVAERE